MAPAPALDLTTSLRGVFNKSMHQDFFGQGVVCVEYRIPSKQNCALCICQQFRMALAAWPERTRSVTA